MKGVGRAVAHGATWVGATWVFAAEKRQPETPEEIAKQFGPSPHPTLRFWVALLIVVGAITGATAAWGAERFMEQAAQNESLFRQDLVGQQLSERLDEETVASGLRHFANYEQATLLAQQLQREADQSRGARALMVGAEAQNEQVLANVDLATDYALQTVTPQRDGGPIANAAAGYSWLVMNDPTLATFEPADRNAAAQHARDDALRMTLVAVLSALAVLLLTLTEIRLRRRTNPPDTGWTSGHNLLVAGIAFWLGSAIWGLSMVHLYQ